MKSFFRSRIIKYTSFTSMLLASLSIAVTPIHASELGARIVATALFDRLSDDWNVRQVYNTGLLQQGQSVIIRTALTGGLSYKIVAAGCEDAYDVDIAVYDEEGNLVARDADTSDLALAEVSPRWTGTFYVKVTMFRVRPGSGSAAHYVLQYAFD